LTFALLNFEIEHEGCWTQLTSYYPVIARTMVAKPDRRRERIFGMDEVKAHRLDDFKRFAKALKRSRAIKEVLEVSPIDGKRKIFRVSILERFDSMVMSVLSNYTVIYLRDFIANGKEFLTLVLPEDEIEQLKEEIRSIGKVYNFEQRQVDVSDFIPSHFDLSKRETEVLIHAFKVGYYELPRKITLETLASELGLSKPTLEEYIRKAERKLISRAVLEIQKYKNQELKS